jgi:hypothetical protein
MNTTIIVAIVGVVSTIVGGVIGAATTYALAVRRETFDVMKERRNEAIEVKRAARLIDAELNRAAAAAHICVEKKHWWTQDVAPLSTEVWEKNGGTIAPHVSDQAWVAIIVAVEAVGNLRSDRAVAAEAGLITQPISDSTAAQLAPVLRDIERGRAALASLVFETVPPPGK